MNSENTYPENEFVTVKDFNDYKIEINEDLLKEAGLRKQITSYLTEAIKKTNGALAGTITALIILSLFTGFGFLSERQKVGRLTNEITSIKASVKESEKKIESAIVQTQLLTGDLEQFKKKTDGRFEKLETDYALIDGEIKRINKEIKALQNTHKAVTKLVVKHPKQLMKQASPSVITRHFPELIDRDDKYHKCPSGIPSRWCPEIMTEMKKHFTDFEIAALSGNIMAESSFSPIIENNIGAIGLCQWLYGRKDRLLQYASIRGTHWVNPTTQVKFLAWECGKYSIPAFGLSSEAVNFNRAVREAHGDVKKAGYLLGLYFERPNPSELSGSAHRRRSVAGITYKWLQEGK